jgi:peptidoglycan/xylan/chitin deacetylase (PgdA/CDA1 family)
MKPQIALTFDDGPSEHTLPILDTLAKHNARASFFVLGGKLEKGAATVKRAADAGHEIISHSWSHCKAPDLSELTAEEMKKELLDTHAAIERLLGKSPAMFRPPYGAVSDTLLDTAAQLGLSVILWSLDAWDWRSLNADEVYEEIFTNIHDGAVILCHDVHPSTVTAMERVIPDLVEKYDLVTVSELMQAEGITPGTRIVYPAGEVGYE